MCSFGYTISTDYRKTVEKQLKAAQQLGDLRHLKYLLTILAVMDGQPFEQIAQCLRVQTKNVKEWVRLFCCYGPKSAPSKKTGGRPSNLMQKQKEELAQLIDDGSLKARYTGACWHSPMIQQMIVDRFGVFYNVFYIAQLLRNLGFS
jgi:transposase